MLRGSAICTRHSTVCINSNCTETGTRNLCHMGEPSAKTGQDGTHHAHLLCPTTALTCNCTYTLTFIPIFFTLTLSITACTNLGELQAKMDLTMSIFLFIGLGKSGLTFVVWYYD